MKQSPGSRDWQEAGRENFRLKRGTLIRNTVVATAYGLLIPLSTVGVVIMYMREHRQRIFVQTINGRPMIEVAPLLIVMDMVSLGAILYWARPKAATLDELEIFSQVANFAPLHLFAFITGTLCLMISMQYMSIYYLCNRRTAKA